MTEFKDDKMDEIGWEDRRRHGRTNFSFPVYFKIFNQPQLESVLSGYILDISEGGSQIQFEDKYGRIEPNILSDQKVKITINLPQGDRINILSTIRWAKKQPDSFHIILGIQFEHLEEWQRVAVEKLIKLKNKDQSMMWNLWEQYEQH